MKDVDLSSKSLADLKYIAQLMGFSDYEKLKKKELIELISKADTKNETETDITQTGNLPSKVMSGSDNNIPERRRPGRPKRINNDIPDKEILNTNTPGENVSLQLPGIGIVQDAGTDIVPVKRKRGRPPKIQSEKPAETETLSSEDITETQETAPYASVIKEESAEYTVSEPIAEIVTEETALPEELSVEETTLPTELSVELPVELPTEIASENIVETIVDPLVKNIEDRISKAIKEVVVEAVEEISEESNKEQTKFVFKTGNNKKKKPSKPQQPVKQSETEPEKYDIFEGMLDVLTDGYGFLRSAGYLSGAQDVYVAPIMIKKFALKTGDKILGKCRMQKDNEKFQALFDVININGYDVETAMKRKPFETLTPIYPDEKFKLEIAPKELSTRLIDLISPIGKGQRGIIVSPPKAGKTVLLKKIANSITTNYPDIELIVLLIDERPEEVTDMRESIKGDVVSSTFDEVPERHIKVAEMVIERAQRLVEHGRDVVILMDSMTRLARAYNLTIPPTGRTLSGGLDPGALHKPKRFFGSARNIRGGGSLTIVSTALVDTGSKMDEVIYEEFKGTGNMELHLDRKLSEKRIFPAIDINKSGTRKEELLLTTTEINSMWAIRKAMTNLGTADVTEMIVNKLIQTKTNDDFVRSINTSNFGIKS